MDNALTELLNQFNRKERFFLIGNALGNEDFGLSYDFRKRLQDAICLKDSIPANAFAAMDYHFDWIAAALTTFAKGDNKQVFANEESDGKKLIMGNQEDVDFIVCFKANDGIYRLIFLEAKGYGAWDSEQMKSKMKRLRHVFGDKGDDIAGVIPILCLISPKEPQRLNYSSWPQWCIPDGGSPFWLKLLLPRKRLVVKRWDTDACKSSKGGRYFRIETGTG